MQVAETLDAVKERPGEWAAIKTYPADKLGSARGWALGVRRKFTGFQIVTAPKDGSVKVFARYVGSGNGSASEREDAVEELESNPPFEQTFG